MGRDEHKKSRGKRALAQTPKQQKISPYDVEYSNELAEQGDIKMQARSKDTFGSKNNDK